MQSSAVSISSIRCPATSNPLALHFTEVGVLSLAIIIKNEKSLITFVMML